MQNIARLVESVVKHIRTLRCTSFDLLNALVARCELPAEVANVEFESQPPYGSSQTASKPTVSPHPYTRQ